MKAILHIFIFFILANTFALSIIEGFVDNEDLTEMSVEEGEDDSEEEEKSDPKSQLYLNLSGNHFSLAFNSYSKRIFKDHNRNYYFLFSNIPFSPPKMMI